MGRKQLKCRLLGGNHIFYFQVASSVCVCRAWSTYGIARYFSTKLYQCSESMTIFTNFNISTDMNIIFICTLFVSILGCIIDPIPCLIVIHPIILKVQPYLKVTYHLLETFPPNNLHFNYLETPLVLQGTNFNNNCIVYMCIKFQVYFIELKSNFDKHNSRNKGGKQLKWRNKGEKRYIEEYWAEHVMHQTISLSSLF